MGDDRLNQALTGIDARKSRIEPILKVRFYRNRAIAVYVKIESHRLFLRGVKYVEDD